MLDAINQAIHEDIRKSRLGLFDQGQPLIGDIVLWPNGKKRRISHKLDDSYQSSFWASGSFFAFKSGHASFSGGLQPPVFAEFLVKTNEIEQASFWFFSHNRSGAGRGVQCELPCRVWRLEPFTRTREQAEAHPRAIHTKEFWGNNKLEYERVVNEIMNPSVISNPEYY